MSLFPPRLISAFGRGAAILAVSAFGLIAASSVVFAGECPAGKTIASGGGGTPATMPKGVTDTVLAAVDLAAEPVDIPDRSLRLRRLVIAPGGIVPWHSHDNRPAIIYVIQGTVTEYASTCAVPIVHRAGEVAPEMHATSHWWKNTGKTAVILLSADLFPAAHDAHVM
jgi:quercetin dioxygenase-like cupin family protein